MRLLVLGGSVFLSREVVLDALQRGHEVVCACRGETGAVPEGATFVRWDRAEPAPQELADAGPYDAVVDVSRVPGHVRRALDAVPDAHWVFVSTVSVYADHSDPAGPGEGALLPAIADDVDITGSPDAYGGMKVACEQLVHDGAATAAVVRPGLIVGPGDPSGRFAYWANRFSSGGDVLAPGAPTDVVQVIDVRDLATWLVGLAEDRTEGVFDGVGRPVPLAELLHDCAPDASLVWVEQDFLGEQGVEPWAGPGSIPLWLPRPEYDGMLSHDARPAIDAGLRLRPVGETCRETQAWLRADPAARIGGISRERERELLDLWRSRDGAGALS